MKRIKKNTSHYIQYIIGGRRNCTQFSKPALNVSPIQFLFTAYKRENKPIVSEPYQCKSSLTRHTHTSTVRKNKNFHFKLKERRKTPLSDIRKS